MAQPTEEFLAASWLPPNWLEDDIWRGEALLAYESPTAVRHYGLDHLGSPAILTDALAHPIGSITLRLRQRRRHRRGDAPVHRT